MQGFSEKLAFVLKALSLSRGRLSAELAVDKSVVSRWLSGARLPTSNNLAALTALIARQAPGFTMHDWDLSAEALEARFGLNSLAQPTDSLPQIPQSFREWLALPKVIEAAANSGDAARAVEGFWRSTAPMGSPKQYARSYSMLSANPDGTLRVESGFFSMRSLGWAVPVGHQFFGCLTGIDGYFSFSVFNRRPAPILDVMDGILLGALADNAGVPIAMPVVMERIEDLCRDPERDALRLAEFLALNPVAPASEVSEPVRRRLRPGLDSSGGSAAASPFLMMASLTSLARGRLAGR